MGIIFLYPHPRHACGSYMAAVVIGDHELPTVALFDVMQMECTQFKFYLAIVLILTSTYTE